MNYRQAILEDLPEIVAIYNATIPGRMVTADTKPVTVADRLEWFHKHNPLRRPLWIFTNDTGSTIGWLSFRDFYGRPAYSGTAEISLYLHEDFHRQGWGRKMLTEAVRQAPHLGLHTLLGFIFKHNEPSMQLFLSEGFQTWGHLPAVAIIDGISRDLAILGLKTIK